MFVLKKWLMGLSLALLVSVGHAQTLPAQSFENQHGETLALDNSVTWMIFAHHNKGAKMTKGAIDQAGIKDFSASKGLYVADISKMPALISKMFAMPAMRKYEFALALDKDGNLTQDWPKQEETVTLMKLNNLTVVDVQYVSTPEAIIEFINANR
jgi:hypothetical protein